MLRSILTGWRGYRLVRRCFMSSDCVASTAVYEPPPFDFEAIDQIVRAKQPDLTKSIDIEKEEKSLFYWLLREANATVYAATVLSKRTRQAVPETETMGAKKTEGEWLCDRIADRLQHYKLDNRIIILQRSLAAYHPSKQHHWHRLAKTALRSCFINDEIPNSNHIVRICAALSKWRCKGFLAEIQTKLDLSILAENQWDINSASHVLWSVGHLKHFDMRSFDYMNNVVSTALGDSAFDVTTLSDDTLHRIVNANLIRLSHSGSHHRVLKDILCSLSSQPIAISYLSPKTLLALTSILPLHPETTIVPALVTRISRSIHKFTHIQLARVLYNFAIIKPNLQAAVIDDIVGVLFEFKESLYKSNALYLPSLTCKLLFTFRTFLEGFDHTFVHKCLSDLNTNLHLLVPYSLVGNLQCLQLYRDAKDTVYNDKQATSISNTWNNLVRLDLRGQFVKPIGRSDTDEPIENLKLWHIAMLNRITGKGYNEMLSRLNSFMDTVDNDNITASLKDFLMFLCNVSANRTLCRDRVLLNSVLIVASQLWNDFGCLNSHGEYWHHILFNLAAMNLMEVFERESNNRFPRISGITKLVPPVAALQICLGGGKGVEKALLAYLHDRASATSRDEMDALITRYIVFTCVANDNAVAKFLDKASRSSIRKILSESFYDGSHGSLFDITEETEERDVALLTCLDKALSMPISPVDLGMAYTRAFFLQDHPKLLLQTLPAIALGELCPQKCYDISIWDVALCLKAKGLSKLVDYLESVKEAKPEKNMELREVTSYLHSPAFDIKRVKRNFNIGPYMCHFGLQGDYDSQGSVCVFLTDAYSSIDMAGKGVPEHLFDRQRRLALKNLGYQFVELSINVTETNVV